MNIMPTREQDFLEIRERLLKGHCSDDMPCVMEYLGCDYEKSCEAVFGRDTMAGIKLLDEAEANYNQYNQKLPNQDIPTPKG